MSEDPIKHLAKLRVIKLSADIEAQLSQNPASGPAIEILRRLRERAAESLAGLAFLNVYDPKDRIKIVTLQNEVKRYDEWLVWLREIVTEGIACEKAMTEEEREEMLDYLTSTPEGEREAIDMGLVDEVPRDA